MDDEPKYAQRGFMAREISLYHAARIGAKLARRNGDDDTPIAPIAPVGAIRRVPAARPLDPGDFGDA